MNPLSGPSSAMVKTVTRPDKYEFGSRRLPSAEELYLPSEFSSESACGQPPTHDGSEQSRVGLKTPEESSARPRKRRSHLPFPLFSPLTASHKIFIHPHPFRSTNHPLGPWFSTRSPRNTGVP